MPTVFWNRIVRFGKYDAVYSPDHPKANSHGYVLLHRAVMESKLGRLLASHEIVHHKDENKRNNADDNIELTTRTEHNRHHQLKRAQPRVKFTCPQCERPFERRRGKTHLLGAYKRTFCSRQCSGAFNARAYSVPKSHPKRG